MKRLFLVILMVMVISILTGSAIADPPANDSCANATNAGILSSGEEVDLTGTVVEATQDCDSTGDAEVWVQFTITGCMDVAIDFCEDENFVGEGTNYLFDECPCGDKINASDDGYCENYNPEYVWYGLSAGTYYYPILANTLDENGIYIISITGENCPEAPANDDCANATAVGETTELAYTTHGAAFDGNGTCMSSPNVWYVYTSTFTGNARVSLDADYSEMLAVYDGADCSSLPTELGCTDDGYLDFAVVAGKQYLIEVGGTGSNTGDGTITIGEAPETPSNDDCADADDAGTLTDDETIQLTGTVEYATPDCDSLDYPEVWIKFTVPDYMHVTIDFCDASEMINMYASSPNLYSDCPCGDYIDYDSYTSCPNENISYTWQYLPAGTYYYPIFNNGEFSSYTINILGEESSTPPNGACCYYYEDDNSCTITDAATCAETYEGTWMGDSTDCTDADENGVADICEEPSGACCYYIGDYNGCILTEELTCSGTYEGTWMGDGTDCSDADENGIADICEGANTGACCYDGGAACGIYTEEECLDMEGDWMGDGTDCTDADENSIADICENTTGACCVEDGLLCELADSEEDCVNGYMGTWMGYGTDCTDADENGIADVCEEPDTYNYLPGDANMAAEAWPAQTIGGDVTYLVNYFRGLADPCKLDGFYASADATGDCMVVGGDVTYLVNYFRGLVDMSYCSNYEPAWPTPSDVPTDAPDGWPNCD